MESGIMLTLCACLGWGAGDVFARKAMFEASPAIVLTSMILLASLVLGIIALAVEGFGSLKIGNLDFFMMVGLMALFTWVTGNLLYFHGMQRAGIVVAAPILGAAPLPAIGLAIIFGGERPNTWILLGAIFIVVGVGILVTDRKRLAN